MATARLGWVLCWGLVLSEVITGPTRAADNPLAFRRGIDLVTLDVCVRDRSGRFLRTLAADDFLIIENGKPQRITFLDPSDALPLRVVLLIDNSGSMTGAKLERAIEAGSEFAAMLRPRDEVEIIAFNGDTSIIHGFDEDRASIDARLRRIVAHGMTGLNEALMVAANELARARRARGPEAREVVIILSDGEDTASVIGFDEVLNALRNSGALVYAVSLRASPDGTWLGANWPLLQLARDTGGRALGVPRLDAVPALYREIDAEVRHLYRIGYVSSDPQRDGKWRTIAVRLRSRDGSIQTRSGYYAPRR